MYHISYIQYNIRNVKILFDFKSFFRAKPSIFRYHARSAFHNVRKRAPARHYKHTRTLKILGKPKEGNFGRISLFFLDAQHIYNPYVMHLEFMFSWNKEQSKKKPTNLPQDFPRWLFFVNTRKGFLSFLWSWFNYAT